MNSLHHYYHVYADGAWKEPLQEHIDALRNSALANQSGFVLRVGIVGDQENAGRVRVFLSKQNVVSHVAAWQREGWEQVTLIALAKDCVNHDGLVFYGHTKGAHNPTPFNADWRRRMTYFNITRWRDAVASLQVNDLYGCHWMELQGNWIFGGNFWWTHMKHIRLLEPPKRENRWRAEDWVGQLRHHISNLRVHDPAPPFPGSVNLPQG